MDGDSKGCFLHSSVIVIDLDRLQRGFTMAPIGIIVAFLLQGIANRSF